MMNRMTAREINLMVTIRAAMNGKDIISMEMKTIPPKYVNNHGQEAERVFAFTTLGIERKADSYAANDIGTMQVKSSHASLNKKTDSIAEYFVYVSNDLKTAWILTPDLWEKFETEFAAMECGVYRIGRANRKMEKWLSEKAI